MSKPQTLVIGKMFVPGHDIISETEWVRKSDYDVLAAENERLRKACELVFGEAAKRKFLRCYPGNDFYVSLEAMEEMKNALGWKTSKEGAARG